MTFSDTVVVKLLVDFVSVANFYSKLDALKSGIPMKILTVAKEGHNSTVISSSIRLR